MGQKAATGQREPPNRGTINDINIVSSLMPYCDAMLIDNKCRAWLEDIPQRYALDYPTRIYSRSDGDEFIAYVRTIEAEADPTHIEEVHSCMAKTGARRL